MVSCMFDGASLTAPLSVLVLLSGKPFFVARWASIVCDAEATSVGAAVFCVVVCVEKFTLLLLFSVSAALSET